MINVTTAKTAELVAFYNEHAEKPVKKFADRKTAERRVQALIDTMIPFEEEQMAEEENAAQPEVEETQPEPEVAEADSLDSSLIAHYGTTECPGCGIHLSNGVGHHDKETKHDKFQYECLGCGEEFGPEIPKVDEKRAAGISASWNNPETRAKRTKRHAVNVDGETYRSVRAAFVALKLPLKEHIKFRMSLKEAGKLEAYGMKWEIIEA